MLDHDGNLLDASGIGAIAALLSAKMPNVIYDEESGEVQILDEYEPLPVSKIPIPVTLAKIGHNILVDPNLDEERVMDGRITITTDEDGMISSVQKSEGGSFKLEEVMYAVDIALKKAAEIREKVLEAVKAE